MCSRPSAAWLLFVWWIRRIGLDEIRSGFAQIGWGIVAIVLLGGVRFALRAAAWMLCVEPPHTLPFREAFGAVIAGDALGNLLPLGPIVSEPTKAAFVRRRLALGPAGTALAIENVLYTLSVAAMIAAGMAALLFVFEHPRAAARSERGGNRRGRRPVPGDARASSGLVRRWSASSSDACCPASEASATWRRFANSNRASILSRAGAGE